MIRNYLVIAWKVLARRRFFTAVSLGGIAFTLTVLLVVSALVDHAIAPGTPEINLNRTLHVNSMLARGGEGDDDWAWQGSPGYGFLDRYVRNIPGVEIMSITTGGKTAISFVEGEKIESELRLTDASYWEILDFEFLAGGPYSEADETAGNLVAVISEATRKRFFSDAPSLNQTIEVDGQRLRVIGVVETVPISRSSGYADIWGPHCVAKDQTYRTKMMGNCNGLLLAESRSEFPRILAEFQSRLPHVEFPDMDDFNSITGTPVTRLEEYLIGIGGEENGVPAIRQALLKILGVFVLFLLLPIINLISINLSRIFERASEIGVRKAFGASSGQLRGTVHLRDIFLCLLGGVLALCCTGVVLWTINQTVWLPNAHLQINVTVFLCSLGFALLLGLLSGAFPAWRMSRMHPVQALKGGV